MPYKKKSTARRSYSKPRSVRGRSGSRKSYGASRGAQTIRLVIEHLTGQAAAASLQAGQIVATVGNKKAIF